MTRTYVDCYTYYNTYVPILSRIGSSIIHTIGGLKGGLHSNTIPTSVIVDIPPTGTVNSFLELNYPRGHTDDNQSSTDNKKIDGGIDEY